MKTILLADPSYTRLMLERTCLGRRGHSIVEAHTGSQGLEQARAHRPHLVLFSYHLGDMNADAFCRAVREDDRTRRTSLLLVVATEPEEIVRRVLGAGANAVITMPLQNAELDEKLATYLNIESRKSVRVIVHTRVQAQSPAGFFLCTSVNLSASGMLLESHAAYAPGTPMDLRFFLPGHPHQIETASHIVRVEEHRGTKCYGVRFDAMDAEHTRLLRQFCQEASWGGGPQSP
jgi:CheY-like chemotaxis protein